MLCARPHAVDGLFFRDRRIFGYHSKVGEENTLYRLMLVVFLAGAECAGARVYVDEKPLADLVRAGVGGVVKTVAYTPVASEDYVAFKDALDESLQALQERGIEVVLEIVPGAAPQPLAMPRPYLNDKGVMLGGEGDRTWLPALDGDFAAFVRAVAQAPVVAIALGGDLQADPLRVRAIERHLAEAVEGTGVPVVRIERRWVDDAAHVAGLAALAAATADEVLVIVGDAAVDRALGAVQRLVGDRAYGELLFDGGVPWVFSFGEGADATLVVVGDLDRVVPGALALRGIEMEDARLALTAGPYAAYDALGEEIAVVGGEIALALDGRGYFLRGARDALVAAVRDARIAGVAPLQVVARDMTGPVGQWSMLQLELGNVLNRPVAGTLRVALGELEVEAPTRLALAAHERRVVELKIVGGQVASDNAYPLRVVFDAGADGQAVHEEVMRVNWIARRSIEVDGKLDDWRGVLPQAIGKGITGFAAYDEEHFYFAAQVKDRTRGGGTLRFAKRDDDAFFYPAVSQQVDVKKGLFKVNRINGASYNPVHLWRPDGRGRVDGRWENAPQVLAFAVDLTIPGNKPRQVAFYIPPGDFGAEGMDLELYDRQRKVAVDRQRLAELGRGVYAVYRLAGKMRITFRAHGWSYRARLGGIFFDPADAAPGFVGFDRETSGEWFDAYGSEGFYVVGAERVDPPDVSLRVPKVVKKAKLRWPEDVRRFSYRREPVLPSGDVPGFDNVQIAFNVGGDAPGWGEYDCTDYEFALNKVAKTYGGGTEVWRLLAPGTARGDFLPRSSGAGQGAVADAELAVVHKGKMRVSEVAIPWEEIPGVKALMKVGEPVKFSFRVNYARTGSRQLGTERSATRRNAAAFHAVGGVHWANELEFGWERE